MTIGLICFTVFANTAEKKFPYFVLVLDVSSLYYWNNFPWFILKYDSFFKFPLFGFFLLWNCSFLSFPNILCLFCNAFSDWNVHKKLRGKLVFFAGTKLSLSIFRKGTIKNKSDFVLGWQHLHEQTWKIRNLFLKRIGHYFYRISKYLTTWHQK